MPLDQCPKCLSLHPQRRGVTQKLSSPPQTHRCDHEFHNPPQPDPPEPGLSGEERARFEAGVKLPEVCRNTWDGLVYADMMTNQRWHDWQAATAAEREACAEIAENPPDGAHLPEYWRYNIAAAIRARGEHD